MAPRTGERMPIPVRDLARERAASISSEVKPYKLSPEEIEAIWAKYPKSPYKGTTKNKRPVGVPNPKLGAEDDMARKLKDGPACGLTRQALLEALSKGEPLSSVERAWGMKYNTIHDWVKKWGLKGITAEKAHELLKEMEEVAAAESQGIVIKPGVSGVGKTESSTNQIEVTVDPHYDATERLKAEIERLKAENVQVVVLAGEATEKLQKQIDRLTDDNKELQREVIEKEVEIGSLVNQVNALKGDNYVPGFLTIRIPIIADTGDRFVMVKKVHEELEEVAAEIETSSIDRRRAAGELYDLVQAFTGLIRAELSDLVVTGSVDELLNQFFEHHNAQHIEKIQRYAAERGWRLVGA